VPTYDYQCDSCGHVFEAFQSMSDNPLRQCPECREDALRRLISGGSGIIFKGSGFYVTDSRKSGTSSGTGKKSDGEGGKSESESKSKSSSESGKGASTTDAA
jgi:putative FmdB family regulatory protein